MKIENITKLATQPSLYEEGTAVMWTDEHISKQLLNVHLNSEIDLASRKTSTINKTVEWILEKTGKNKMEILDLGCGPGLYSAKFAELGHSVTGIDFSQSSIEYAEKEARGKNLNISYRHQNYLELDEENKYDLVILIYTDFGVLVPEDRDILLAKIHRALKPDGMFIFDVLSNKNIEKKVVAKNWEVSESGFWRNQPHMVLSESFLYPDSDIILYQHIVVDDFKVENYRFWTHFYSHDKLQGILDKKNYRNISFYEDVLPASDLWDGDNVTFCIATKK